MALDYRFLLKGIDLSPGLSDLADALQKRQQLAMTSRKADEQERHDRALEDYNRSISDQANMRANAANNREQRLHDASMNDRSMKAALAARDALGHGDPSLFQATIGGAGITDNVIHPGEAPVAPTPPGPAPAEPQPTFVGPIDSPEHAALLARREAMNRQPPEGEMTTSDLEQARADAAAADAKKNVADQEVQVRDYQNQLEGYRHEADQHRADEAAYTAAASEFPQKQQQYEDNVVHELALPNGQKVRLAANDARYAASSKDAQDFRSALLPALQAEMRQAQALPDPTASAMAQRNVSQKMDYLAELTGEIQSGARKAADAGRAFDAASQFGVREARTMSEGDKNRANALQKQRIANQRPIIAAQAQRPQTDFKEENAFRAERNDFEKRYNLPKDMQAYRDLSNQFTSINDNHNPMLQSGVAMAIARSIQGVGPLTDKDVDRLNMTPGISGKLENILEHWDTGEVGPETKAVLTGAVRKLAADKIRNVEMARKAYQGFYDPNLPYLQRFGKGYLDATGNMIFGAAGLSGPGAPSGTEDVPPTPSRAGGGRKAPRAAPKAPTSAAHPGVQKFIQFLQGGE